MQQFLGCWTRSTNAFEAIQCLVQDGDRIWSHSLYREDQTTPRQQVLLPFHPGQAIDHGAFTIHAQLDDGRLTLQVEHDHQHVLRQVLTVVDDQLRVHQTRPDGTEEQLWQRSRVKQVIVYRRDLKMRKGKIAAQCAHASLKVLLDRNQASGMQIRAMLPGPMAVWIRSSFAKVVLSVDDEEALETVYRLAQEHGIPTARITDAGRTEFHGVPTRTTVAVGPWTVAAIDAITGPEGRVATKLA